MSSVANYGGAKFDPTTMEVLVTAMVAAAMVIYGCYGTLWLYAQVMANLNKERRPSFDMLMQRRRQSEEKKVNAGRRLICPTCSGGVRFAEKCWIANPAAMEECIQQNVVTKKSARENYARRLKKIAAN
ncbi:hypothetical protein CYMTET_9295 [Cymbomonas tetramitiformis]|uniref:Uncharacterized protein n=1 Tax=Cymbomonas tetramitiformis TaxID=36881 RepID=A0AAE0GT29_9CHLO|nr:hypothetical protein CYMTET_9295 [Cymbomonas tetramitiformis]